MKRTLLYFILFGIFFVVSQSMVTTFASKTQLPSSIESLNPKNDIPNIFRPIGLWFKRIFGKRPKAYTGHFPARVIDFNLSRNEIDNCRNELNFLPANAKTIDISTNASNPETVIYHYYVTGGEILDARLDKPGFYSFAEPNKGSKAVWNLSDVKPGRYAITAAVDDGCGFCGKTATKEIRVVECQKATSPNPK